MTTFCADGSVHVSLAQGSQISAPMKKYPGFWPAIHVIHDYENVSMKLNLNLLHWYCMVRRFFVYSPSRPTEASTFHYSTWCQLAVMLGLPEHNSKSHNSHRANSHAHKPLTYFHFYRLNSIRGTYTPVGHYIVVCFKRANIYTENLSYIESSGAAGRRAVSVRVFALFTVLPSSSYAFSV